MAMLLSASAMDVQRWPMWRRAEENPMGPSAMADPRKGERRAASRMAIETSAMVDRRWLLSSDRERRAAIVGAPRETVSSVEEAKGAAIRTEGTEIAIAKGDTFNLPTMDDGR